VQRVWNVIGFIIAFGLLGFAGWAIIRGVEKDPSVVGSFATALAAVVAVVLARVYEKRLEVQQAHRDKIAPQYQKLFEHVSQMTPKKRGGNPVDFYRKLSRDLLFYGSDDVVQTWLAWTRSVDPESDVTMADMLAWERVLFAIRKDLGHKNEGLQAGDLLRLYVNDIDEHLAAWRASQGPSAANLAP
jgi:hypothetical protein